MNKRILLLAVAVAVALGLWAAPEEAEAGACCASAAAFGVGRLLRWEKAAMGLRTNLLHGLGQWDIQGKWRPNRADFTSLGWRSELWGMVGIGRSFSVYARLPWLLNYRRSDDNEALGGGFADIQVGGRWDIVGVGTHKLLPGIAVTLDVLAPTGRRTAPGQSPLGAEVTGRGAWELSAGAIVEKVLVPWFIQFQLGLRVPLPFYREDIDAHQRFGINAIATLANGFELIPNTLVLSLVLRFRWEDDLEMDGRRIPSSAKLTLGAIAALAWRFDPHWTLQFSADSGLFLDHLGTNDLGQITWSLGLRYGFF